MNRTDYLAIEDGDVRSVSLLRSNEAVGQWMEVYRGPVLFTVTYTNDGIKSDRIISVMVPDERHWPSYSTEINLFKDFLFTDGYMLQLVGDEDT